MVLPPPAPATSWAEDLNTYRATRGTQALSTLSQMEAPVTRMTRTGHMPFADPMHPHYSYELPEITSGPEAEMQTLRQGRRGTEHL